MHVEAVESIGVAAIVGLLLEACRGMLTIPGNRAVWRGAEKVAWHSYFSGVAIESDTCDTSGSNDCPRDVELLH